MSLAGDNGAGTTAKRRETDLATNMAAFDALPWVVREALRNSLVDWVCVTPFEWVQAGADPRDVAYEVRLNDRVTASLWKAERKNDAVIDAQRARWAKQQRRRAMDRRLRARGVL